MPSKCANRFMLLFCCLWCWGCVAANDPGRRAMSFEVGGSETELIREAGPPTTTEPVRATLRNTLCREQISQGAYRALVYDLPTTGIRAWLRRHITRLQPDITVVVCVSDAGVIVGRYYIER